MHSLINDAPLCHVCMTMLFLIISFVGMVVDGFIPLMDVGVGMDMFVRMGMYQIAMPVFVGVNMRMLMGVLQADGIFYHQNGCNDHNAEAHIELNTGPLIQKQHSEGYTQEGCDGIVGAGLGSAQILLGFDVEIDAEAVGYEAK